MRKNLEVFNYPLDTHSLSRRKKSLKNFLEIESVNFIEIKVAILGGSTTSEVRDMLELFLLKDGFKPVFFESDYGRYYEDAVFPNEKMLIFAPDIVYIHTTVRNIQEYPGYSDTLQQVEDLLNKEVDKFVSIWEGIQEKFKCSIIQNNFELPSFRPLGNLDFNFSNGRCRFISSLNQKLLEEINKRPNIHINDINWLSAWIGLERWHDKKLWYAYKYAMGYDAIPYLAQNIQSIINAIFGKSKKCLVLDMDNTLWGGIIGDDGLQGIEIGKDSPEALAYEEFQEYIKVMKSRGILLAIASKNDEKNALDGLDHPSSKLIRADFSAFFANWEPKSTNINSIAMNLNIGKDALVFVDDNPAEREIVRMHESAVFVPEIGSDVTQFINILDGLRLFETVSLSIEDINRSSQYLKDTERKRSIQNFGNYDEYLKSLEMKAIITPFSIGNIERVTQLTNKTNQFNLTTKRYSQAELATRINNRNFISLCGKLIDKFGDNGLVSVVSGEVLGKKLFIDLWLMSCRVLKRGMEDAMLSELLRISRGQVEEIIGTYIPTSKNSMVSNLYEELGFQFINIDSNGAVKWRLDCTSSPINKPIQIEVKYDQF